MITLEGGRVERRRERRMLGGRDKQGLKYFSKTKKNRWDHSPTIRHYRMSAHNNLNTNNIIFVNRIREMVSFELGEEIRKDVFRLLTSVEQRKTSESARRIEPHIFEFHLRESEHEIPWSGVRLLMETQNFFSFFFTLVTRRTTSSSTLLLLWKLAMQMDVKVFTST